MNKPADATPKRYRPLVRILISEAGGYLNNTIRDGTTCQTCTTPINLGYTMCRPCQDRRSTHGTRLADNTAFLTYAIDGAQSAFTMYRYKDPIPRDSPLRVVQMLAVTGLALHGRCIEKIAHTSITNWTVIPSLKGRPDPHPLRRIVAPFAPGSPSTTTPSAQSGSRDTEADLFSVSPLPRGAHLLIIDDTWAGGGHAQSLALAARQAGAATVSILVLARWLNPRYNDNRTFVGDRLTRPFDPYQCPWTNSICPS